MNLSPLFTVIFAVVCALAGSVFGYEYSRTRSRAQIADLTEQLLTARTRAAQAEGEALQLARFHEETQQNRLRENAVMQALAPLRKELSDMHIQVGQMERNNAATAAKMFTRLEQDARIQSELAHTANSLNSALHSVSARGMWGEVQLKRIIEAAGMLEHVDFELQSATTAENRPDAVISLPGGGKIAIDAKAPLTALLKIGDAPGADRTRFAAHCAPETAKDRSETKEYLLARHAKDLAKHIHDLAKRNYPGDFPHSPQITVLFLPAESLLSGALEADPALLENAFRQGIIPATPGSLLALLRSVASVWSSAAAAGEAERIVSFGQSLVDRLATVSGHLQSLGKNLQNAVSNYNKTVASVETRLLVTAREFKSLHTEKKELNEGLSQLQTGTAVRPFTADEIPQTNP